MSDQFAFVIEGSDAFKGIAELEGKCLQAAQRAVNRAADKGRSDAAAWMMKTTNFPSGYLADNNGKGRLAVTNRATLESLEASITGRQRPTSLARFSSSGKVNAPGVNVSVKPGAARFLKRAFLIKLRSGSSSLESSFNLGLAVRLKPGASLRNSRVKRIGKVSKSGSALYLLYGPSVDQTFALAIAPISPSIAANLEAEYLRQLDDVLK